MIEVGALSDWKEQLKDRLSTRRWTVILIVLSIVIGVLILTINFWRTLLLVILVAVSYFIGSMMDKGGWEMVKTFFERILQK